ncbi:MAG: 3-hydroxyacyl-ACP dehydratase FabZ [Candidatus Omnitrophota bacterium]|jgi:3-hydroxyacyl-[acyl-carrier-protein] dehydratase
MLSIEEIQKILPQRYPFLMIDRVLELEAGKRIVALKNLSTNEYFFEGHFPGHPVMPGALIIEAIAQASIVLFFSGQSGLSSGKQAYYLASVKVRFLNPVFPGDQMKIKVEPVKMISTGAIVSAYVEAGGKEIAKGELSFSCSGSK